MGRGAAVGERSARGGGAEKRNGCGKRTFHRAKRVEAPDAVLENALIRGRARRFATDHSMPRGRRQDGGATECKRRGKTALSAQPNGTKK